MKNTLKLWILVLVMTLSVAACKKKDSPEPAPQPVEVKLLTITDLKALSTTASVKLPDARKIKGIVISDASAKNIDAKTVVLQEATDKPGIIVTFDAAQTFAMGDEVEVVVSNQTLAQVNGEIVVQNVPSANAKKIGTGSITTKATNIADIITNKAAWNGTLVSIGSGLFAGNGKYTGTINYSVENGTIQTTVLSGSTFENSDYPVLVNGLTGILRISGNNVFINIRNTSDVKQSESFILVEDFSGADKAVYSNLNSSDPLYFQTTITKKYPTPFQGVGQIINYTVADLSFGLVKNLNTGSNDADASFLTPGRNYYCVLPYTTPEMLAGFTNSNSSWFQTEFHRFAGSIALFRNPGSDDSDWHKNLKNITVVFAGSKMKVSDFTSAFSNVTVSQDGTAFDATKDGFSASLTTNVLDKIDVSPVYSNQGQWQTATFKDISTKLATLDKDGKGFRNPMYLTFISKANQRGAFSLNVGQGYNYVTGSAIVIDKIIFEYSEKPDWAN